MIEAICRLVEPRAEGEGRKLDGEESQGQFFLERRSAANSNGSSLSHLGGSRRST
jgi:hypothetical protein